MLKDTIKAFAKLHPARIVLLGYLFYFFLGLLVLMLPICHTKPISFVDHIFTAMSALSTTGLVTIDIGKEYSFLGQIVILLLIQTGGFGYMTLNTFVVLATTNKISKFRQKITKTAFPLPKEFNIAEFIYHVVIFMFVCELIGAIILSVVFMNNGVENFIWNGIFHSISAFCTAGFSLFPDNLMSFKYSFSVNAAISTLSILGAIGFITFVNIYKKLAGEKKYITFTTKVILAVTFWFLSIGTLIFFLSEDIAAPGSIYQKLITAFFQVMSASTTVGFNSLDIGALNQVTILLLTFLMIFGASPSGTGGGLKSTTFVALFGLVKSTVKGEGVVSFWKRVIPPKRLRLATATFAYYMFVLVLSLFLLISWENKPFVPILFEAASALGTVGLSMGITATLTIVGKLLISLLMFMGKMGILTFGIAIASHYIEDVEYKEDNDIVF